MPEPLMFEITCAVCGEVVGSCGKEFPEPVICTSCTGPEVEEEVEEDDVPEPEEEKEDE
jgi:hypothetical protein